MDTQMRELFFFSGSNNFVDCLDKRSVFKRERKKKKKAPMPGLRIGNSKGKAEAIGKLSVRERGLLRMCLWSCLGFEVS